MSVGVPPAGSGCQPAASAAEEASSLSGIPNAELKYEFFTPYHRGFDLVFDFLCAQRAGCFERKPWSITASYGYERSRSASVLAEDQYVGTAHALAERFAPLAPAYQRFMHEVETAATVWAAEKLAADEADALQHSLDDAALCDRVLAASAMSAETAETRSGSGLQPASAVAESQTPNPSSSAQDDPS